MKRTNLAFIVMTLIFMTVDSRSSCAAGDQAQHQTKKMYVAMQKIDIACKDPSGPDCAVMLNQIEPSIDTSESADSVPPKKQAENGNTVASASLKPFTQR